MTTFQYNQLLYLIHVQKLKINVDLYGKKNFQEVLILLYSIFFQKLLASTVVMLKNDGSQTNEDAFTHHFITDLPEINYEECRNRFYRFYEETFHKVGSIVQPVPEGRLIIQSALRAGLQVAIATNPIFPKIATNQRLEWANIADLDLSLVTHAENMSYCKPHPEYYRKILEILNRQPEECLMVGNDPISDMSAAEVGIKTFLIENETEKVRLGLISAQIAHQSKKAFSKSQYHVDWRGTLKDLETLLQSK